MNDDMICEDDTAMEKTLLYREHVYEAKMLVTENSGGYGLTTLMP